MEQITANSITDKQKLTIENGINTYLYIMRHQKENNDDFRDVYYNYYLTARSSVFSKVKNNKESGEKTANPNWDLYFQLLNESTGKESLESIVEKLKQKLTSHSFEFSFASKLLHTKNPYVPIYDSKVRKYLEEVYGKKFSSESGTKTISKIKADWIMLNEWYKEFLATNEAMQLIDWFDKEFPKGKNISKIKKIDTIIFACVD